MDAVKFFERALLVQAQRNSCQFEMKNIYVTLPSDLHGKTKGNFFAISCTLLNIVRNEILDWLYTAIISNRYLGKIKGEEKLRVFLQDISATILKVSNVWENHKKTRFLSLFALPTRAQRLVRFWLRNKIWSKFFFQNVMLILVLKDNLCRRKIWPCFYLKMREIKVIDTAISNKIPKIDDIATNG